MYGEHNVIYSLNAIYRRKWEVSILASGGEHQSISLHKGERYSAKELTRGLSLVQPLAPCQSRGYQLDLNYCSLMEAAKSLKGKRQEDNTFTKTSFGSFSHFSLARFLQSRTSLGGSLSNVGRAEWAGHGHVNGAIFAICPMSSGGWRCHLAAPRCRAASASPPCSAQDLHSQPPRKVHP